MHRTVRPRREIKRDYKEEEKVKKLTIFVHWLDSMGWAYKKCYLGPPTKASFLCGPDHS